MSERGSQIKVSTRIGADLTVLGIVDDGGREPVYLVWNYKSWCPMGCKVFKSTELAQRVAEILLALGHPNTVRCFRGYGIKLSAHGVPRRADTACAVE